MSKYCFYKLSTQNDKCFRNKADVGAHACKSQHSMMLRQEGHKI